MTGPDNESLPTASLKTRVAVIVAVISTIIIIALLIGLSIAGSSSNGNTSKNITVKLTEPGSYGGNPDGGDPTPDLAKSVCEESGHKWEKDDTSEPNNPEDESEADFLSSIESAYVCYSADIEQSDPNFLYYRIVFMNKDFNDIEYLSSIIAALVASESSDFQALELTKDYVKLLTSADSLSYFLAFYKNVSIEQLYAPSIEKGNEILSALGFPDRSYYPQDN